MYLYLELACQKREETKLGEVERAVRAQKCVIERVKQLRGERWGRFWEIWQKPESAVTEGLTS